MFRVVIGYQGQTQFSRHFGASGFRKQPAIRICKTVQFNLTNAQPRELLGQWTMAVIQSRR